MKAASMVAVIAAAMVLPACGQKGALYLPKRGTVVTRPAGTNAQQQTEPSAAPEAPAAQKPEDKDDTDKPKPQR